MTIRSIDLQILIPRATDASRTQQQNNQLPIIQQQQATEQFQQTTAARQHQVQGLDKSEGQKIHQDNEKEKGKNDSSKKKRMKSALAVAEHDAVKDPVRGKNVDIST